MVAVMLAPLNLVFVFLLELYFYIIQSAKPSMDF